MAGYPGGARQRSNPPRIAAMSVSGDGRDMTPEQRAGGEGRLVGATPVPLIPCHTTGVKLPHAASSPRSARSEVRPRVATKGALWRASSQPSNHSHGSSNPVPSLIPRPLVSSTSIAVMPSSNVCYSAPYSHAFSRSFDGTVMFLASSSSPNSSRMQTAIRLAFPASMFSPLVASATALDGAVAELPPPSAHVPACREPRVRPRAKGRIGRTR